MAEIPDYVIDALEYVRETGETNMFGRDAVIKIAYDNEFHEAALWLHDNKRLYVDALHALGERLSSDE